MVAPSLPYATQPPPKHIHAHCNPIIAQMQELPFHYSKKRTADLRDKTFMLANPVIVLV